MEQNYKRLAAATMAALFVGNIVPETVGMDGPSTEQSRKERVATLINGQEIRINCEDCESILSAFKQAIEASDFPSARAIGNLRYTFAYLLPNSKSYDNEFDNIAVSAMEKNPKAGILESKLSARTRLLLALDAVTDDNYVQQYEKCHRTFSGMGSHMLADPENSPKNILERVNPKTEAGQNLKQDLLREFSL